MRYSSKGGLTNSSTNQVFGVDFHNFIQHERTLTSMELAQEFGVTLREVNILKRKMERN